MWHRQWLDKAAGTLPVTCVQGAREEGSACRLLRNRRVTVVTFGEGHHFSGEYGRLVKVIRRAR